MVACKGEGERREGPIGDILRVSWALDPGRGGCLRYGAISCCLEALKSASVVEHHRLV